MYRLQEETAKVEEHLLDGSFTRAIIKCFTTSKANAFENLLEPLQKLLRLSQPIALSLAESDLFGRILQKLQSNKAVVRLNLLRIVRSICDASEEQGGLISRYGLFDTVQRLAEVDGAVLVRNMASELIRSCENNDTIGVSGGKRRPGRRTSTSNTPPSLLTRHSTPPTPTSSRSSNSIQSFLERNPRPLSAMNGALPYRPVSRDGSNAGSTARSRLPRTTAIRQSMTSPHKEENAVLNTLSHEISQLPTSNSRRRRRVSGEKKC